MALYIELCVKGTIRVDGEREAESVRCVARSQIHGKVYVMTGAHFIADISISVEVMEIVTFL